MNPALHRGWRKAARTVLQLVASGALTAAVDTVAGGLSPNAKALVGAAWLIAVSFAQNYAETAGKIPVVLPTPGLVPSAAPVVAPAVGVVDTTVEKIGDSLGDVTGTVTGIAGDLIGEVTPPGEED